ncbi:MAG: hypothetical protein ACI855_002276 [Myxococcota bacterium]|jgi:hypothetical protein
MRGVAGKWARGKVNHDVAATMLWQSWPFARHRVESATDSVGIVGGSAQQPGADAAELAVERHAESDSSAMSATDTS